MIEAAQMTTTQSLPLVKQAQGKVFPEIALLVNDWIQHQLGALPSFELSHGILAKWTDQIGRSNAIVRSLGQYQVGIATLSASIVAELSEPVLDWAELWQLLGSDLSLKIGEYLTAQWEKTDEVNFSQLKETQARSIYFSLSALPISSQLYMQIDIQVRPQHLAKKEGAKSNVEVSCAAGLELGLTSLAHSELSQVEVGGLFVFGLQKQTEIPVPIAFGRLGKCRLPANWNIETGEITMLNIEQMAALESEEQHADPEQTYLSVTDLKVPIRAVVELDGLSLETLKNLQPQQVLSSNVKVEDCVVKLSANGQVFAQGQLLEMNGQLCVRVTEVY
jgi:flagellar motor switch/type III secretory pathway protein FliN